MQDNVLEPLRSDFCGVYFFESSASQYLAMTVPWPEYNSKAFGVVSQFGNFLLHAYCSATGTVFNHVRGAYRDNCTSRLSHLTTSSSHLTVTICEILLSSFFSFRVKLKVLKSFISAQLATRFCHGS